MKKLAFAGALALALASSGCAQINAARDWVIDPKTQAAAQVFGAGIKVVICGLASGASIALGVEKAGQTEGQYATGIVYTSSQLVCSALGGTAKGTAVTSGGETVVTAAAK